MVETEEDRQARQQQTLLYKVACDSGIGIIRGMGAIFGALESLTDWLIDCLITTTEYKEGRDFLSSRSSISYVTAMLCCILMGQEFPEIQASKRSEVLSRLLSTKREGWKKLGRRRDLVRFDSLAKNLSCLGWFSPYHTSSAVSIDCIMHPLLRLPTYLPYFIVIIA